jgi:hypothetical protein
MEPPARREVRSSEPTVLLCSMENMICQTMPAPTMPMEVQIRELVQQEPAAISMEPPARREAHSSEPTAPHRSKENITYQMKPEMTEPKKLPAKSVYPQEPAASSMERPARREIHSSEPSALHCPKESTTCQIFQMKPAPAKPKELPTK